jgi:hypothetical protein
MQTFSDSTITTTIQGILKSPVVGYLIIRSASDVTLRIDSITTADAGIFSAQINTASPSTRSVIDATTKTSLMTGSASFGRKGFMMTNNRAPTGITLSVEIPSKTAPTHITISTKDVRIV